MIRELPRQWKKVKEKKNENTKKSNDPQQDKHIPVPLKEKTIFPPLVQLFNQSTNRIACLTAFEGGEKPKSFFPIPPSLLEIHRVLSFIFVFPVCTSVRCLLTFFFSFLIFSLVFRCLVPVAVFVAVVVVGFFFWFFFASPKESPFPSAARRLAW